jgi:phosphate starvation-inducible PhoH-like protein
MVVTGDVTQVDLPPGARSGLADALEALRGVETEGVGIGICDVTDPREIRILHASAAATPGNPRSERSPPLAGTGRAAYR